MLILWGSKEIFWKSTKASLSHSNPVQPVVIVSPTYIFYIWVAFSLGIRKNRLQKGGESDKAKFVHSTASN
jgi:hypothetical protein